MPKSKKQPKVEVKKEVEPKYSHRLKNPAVVSLLGLADDKVEFVEKMSNVEVKVKSGDKEYVVGVEELEEIE